MNNSIKLACLVAVMISVVSGCSSFKTNFLFRSEDNSHWRKEKHLKGVPITLKIPTHVRVDILEKRYIFKGGSDEGIHNVSQQYPLRAVEYTPIETEKIFLVDLKRPGAGTIDTTIDFDADEQYFKEIQNKATDTTLDAISGLLGQIAPSGLIGAPTSETGERGAATFGSQIKELKTVVASRVFEFEAPDFEIEISQFLCEHLNRCHVCKVGDIALGVSPSKSGTTTSPGVFHTGEDSRIGIGDFNVPPPTPTPLATPTDETGFGFGEASSYQGDR